ncbi:MAG: hypothetical protein ABJL44_17110 [Algibacter sp.]
MKHLVKIQVLLNMATDQELLQRRFINFKNRNGIVWSGSKRYAH